MLRSWKFWSVFGGLAAVVALFTYGFFTDPKLVPSPLIGKPAPAFQVTGLGGRSDLSLEALRGTPVILNFWASWCVACRDEALVLQEAHVRYEQGEGLLRVVGVAIGEPRHRLP